MYQILSGLILAFLVLVESRQEVYGINPEYTEKARKCQRTCYFYSE